MDNQDQDEKKDLTSNLYRIAPEVKALLLHALTVCEGIPVFQDRPLLQRAYNDLSAPMRDTSYATPPKANVDLSNDAVAKVAVNNNLELVRRFIDIELKRAESVETKEVLNRLLRKVPNPI